MALPVLASTIHKNRQIKYVWCTLCIVQLKKGFSFNVIFYNLQFSKKWSVDSRRLVLHVTISIYFFFSFFIYYKTKIWILFILSHVRTIEKCSNGIQFRTTTTLTNPYSRLVYVWSINNYFQTIDHCKIYLLLFIFLIIYF